MRAQNRNSYRYGAVLAMLGGICWGFSGTCGQFLFTHTDVSVLVLTCTRMIFGGAILIAAGFLMQRDRMTGIWKEPKDVLRMILFAICGLLICQYTYLTAIACSNAGTATVLQYLGPVMIMLILCIYRRKLPTGKEVLALVLALAGVFLLATHGEPGSLAISGEALFWGLAAAVGLVLYSMIPGSLIRKWGSFAVIGYGLLIAGAVLGTAVRIWTVPFTVTPQAILGIAGVTVPGTALAFSLYLQGVAVIGAAHASLFACTEPVAATIFAVLWMKTEFHPIDLAGFAAIILAVILLSLQKKN